MYAAEELLTIPGAQVSVYERLPAPHGLVRSGVAPDHRRTRRVSRQLDRIAAHPGLTLHLGVEVGRAGPGRTHPGAEAGRWITHDELRRTHDAVIYAVGAAADRRLDIPGADLPGVLTATELVAWYNGHPDHADRAVDLSGTTRAVVVGNGNVALDVARILTIDPDALDGTDVAPAALAALRASRIEEVVVVARRGPEHSAFTLPELVGLSATPGVALTVPAADLRRRAAIRSSSCCGASARRAAPGARITLRYDGAPVRVIAGGIEFAGGATLDAQLLLTSIGYRGLPVADCRSTRRPAPSPTRTAASPRGRTSSAGSSADRPASSAPTRAARRTRSRRWSPTTTPADSSGSWPGPSPHDLNDLPSAAKRCAERNGLQRRGRDSNPRYVGYTHNGFRDYPIPVLIWPARSRDSTFRVNAGRTAGRTAIPTRASATPPNVRSLISTILNMRAHVVLASGESHLRTLI